MQEIEDEHNAKVKALNDEETELENEYESDQEDETLTEKKTALDKAQLELEKAKSQLSVKTYSQNADGSWTFGYTTNQSNVDSAQDSYDSANKDYNDTIKEQEHNAQKKVIEDEKTAEDNSYNTVKDEADKEYNEKKKWLDQYTKTFEEQLEGQKNILDDYYKDTDKLAQQELNKLNQEYAGDVVSEANGMEASLTQLQNKMSQMTTIKDYLGSDKLEDAIESGDYEKYLSYINQNKDSLDKMSKIDLGSLKEQLNNIGDAEKELNKSTNSSDENFDTILTNKTTQVSKEIDIQNTGLQTQLTDLKNNNSNIDTEISAHDANVLTAQNTAQSNQINSFKSFASTYLTLADKFTELLQVLYDFRFSNMVTIAEESNNLIMEGLVVAEEAYEKYREMEEAMGINVSDISIADVQKQLESYKETVNDWTSSKSSLYSSNAFSAYANQVGNSLASALTSSLNSAVASSTINSRNSSNTTNNSSSNTTTVNINGVQVQADNAQEFLQSVLKLANSKTNLTT
jgi:hypothetical protein